MIIGCYADIAAKQNKFEFSTTVYLSLLQELIDLRRASEKKIIKNNNY